MLRAVGFDLGETLLTYADTPQSWAALYRPALICLAEACHSDPDESSFARAEAVLARHNTRLHPRANEIHAEPIFRAVLETWGITSSEKISAAISAFFGFFQQRLIGYPDSLITLTSLRSSGFRLGILTDVPYGMPREFVLRDLRVSGIDQAIDMLLTSVEVGWRKPAAPGFKALAAALEVRTSELWYVGNEEKDVAGALEVGATAVLIDRENRRPRWRQTHTIRSLDELGLLLEKKAPATQ